MSAASSVFARCLISSVLTLGLLLLSLGSGVANADKLHETLFSADKIATSFQAGPGAETATLPAQESGHSIQPLLDFFQRHILRTDKDNTVSPQPPASVTTESTATETTATETTAASSTESLVGPDDELRSGPPAPVETAHRLPIISLVPPVSSRTATQTARQLGALNDLPLEIESDIPTLQTIDLITPPADLWQRIRNGFSMANLDSPLVADRQAWYLNHPGTLKEILRRGRRYLYYIVDELEKRGMPTELALLPMVESAYNPMAYSPAQAAGLWQFIPSTGKNYRLQQNGWLDQRRDIIASTGAALDYLQNIYEMHGDWHLALASYNWGEAAVARAIAKNEARNRPTDYINLDMPAETRYYVPKLQALKNILAQPAAFGLTIDPIPNEAYFDTVKHTDNIDLAVAAKLAEMPLNEFLALNPAYKLPIMPANQGSPIVLPVDKVDTFLANLERHEASDQPLSNWTTHTLKKGESLAQVAKRHHLSLARLKQINNLGKRSRVNPGTRLLVPGKGVQLAALPNIDPPQARAPARKAKRKRSTTRKLRGKSGKTAKSAKTTNATKKSGKAAHTPAHSHKTASKHSKR